ncbi:MAG: DUF4412 domain-containing protein [Nitrospirae bacterium]|nr:MAG: DUF4412 domain-containing protein [Nitrospirota bacterium]
MSLLIVAIIALTSLVGVLPAGAAQRSVPQVEYSADSISQTEDITMQEHVYVTPTKERHEMQGGANAENPIRIFRRDTKVMWQLMPSEKMYMEHKMGQGNPRERDMSQWDFDETVMGEEVLNGMKVTKYKTIATSSDGKKYGGFSWRTKEGISIKTDLLYKEGNEKHRMMTELKNVKIGKQDPQLFEIPQGYTKFDMGGMMGGAMGREGMGQPGMNRPARPGMNRPPEEAPATPETVPPADDRSDTDKANDMMKKLFGR